MPNKLLELVRQKSRKLWDKNIVFNAALNGNPLGRISIPLPPFTSRQLSDSFCEIRSQVQEIIDAAAIHRFHIEFQEINHRQLGVQRIPLQVVFNSLQDFLRFTAKEKEYKIFCATVEYILQQQPRLNEWLIGNVDKVLPYQPQWPGLLQVCQYFLDNPLPDRYIRELQIALVDSKFIENNKTILSLLLNELLPSDAIKQTDNHYRRYDFEMRYGLKYIESLIRCRFLDPNLISGNWFNAIYDVSIPLSQFAMLNPPCQKIYITENKINGLSFPDTPFAIIIFGLGYGIESLKNIDWFRDKEIIYWGDIDTHGMAMLSQLRGYYPQTQSMLMDYATLTTFKTMWVSEAEHTRCHSKLANLTKEEQALYQLLLSNELGECIRLEQERISYAYLIERLNLGNNSQFKY